MRNLFKKKPKVNAISSANSSVPRPRRNAISSANSSVPRPRRNAIVDVTESMTDKLKMANVKKSTSLINKIKQNKIQIAAATTAVVAAGVVLSQEPVKSEERKEDDVAMIDDQYINTEDFIYQQEDNLNPDEDADKLESLDNNDNPIEIETNNTTKSISDSIINIVDSHRDLNDKQFNVNNNQIINQNNLESETVESTSNNFYLLIFFIFICIGIYLYYIKTNHI